MSQFLALLNHCATIPLFLSLSLCFSLSFPFLLPANLWMFAFACHNFSYLFRVLLSSVNVSSRHYHPSHFDAISVAFLPFPLSDSVTQVAVPRPTALSFQDASLHLSRRACPSMSLYVRPYVCLLTLRKNRQKTL